MLAKAKETENMAVLYEIMIKHISAMYEEQRMNHKISCSYILEKFSNQLLWCKLVLISHGMLQVYLKMNPML